MINDLPGRLQSLASGIASHDAPGVAHLLHPFLHWLRQPLPAEGARAAVDAVVRVARALYSHGRSAEGLPLAHELFAACRASGERAQARRAAVLCGLLCSDSADLVGAIEHHVWVLRDAAADEDRFEMARAWVNIGQAIGVSGRYELASRCYLRCLVLLEPSAAEPRTTRQLALGNLADCCFHLGEVDDGLAYGERALLELARLPEQDTYPAIVLRRTMVRLLLSRNRVQEAAAYVAEAAALAEREPSPRAAIASEIMRAAYEMATGAEDLALTRLDRALGCAREVPATLHDALAWAVRAEEAVGNPARALMRMQELSEHVYSHAIERTRAMVGAAGIEPEEAAAEQRTAQARARLTGMLDPPRAPAGWAALRRLAAGAVLRMDESSWHGVRVGAMVKAMALAQGQTPLQAAELGLAAELHDIGMASVPAGIVAKEGPLNDAEREIVRRHPDAGAAMLLDDRHPRLLLAREIARYHHTRWDGAGYPGRVSGTAIPLAARMCAIADAYDMMVSGFGGGVRQSMGAALEVLREESARQFDPGLVSCFDSLIRGELEGMGIDPCASPGLEDFQDLVASLKDDRGFV